MSDSKSSYSLSDKVNQIQGKIGTTNVLNSFIGNDFMSKLRSKNNKDDQNLLKVLADLLVSLVGSQEQMKKVILNLMTSNLPQLEIKIKKLIKQHALQLLSCGLNAKLNVPNGVVNQPLVYPYIDQYDFYGLFSRDINNPIEKLKFDDNLNSFIKTNIDTNTSIFTWKNKDNTDVVKFTYNEPDEQILVGPPPSTSWDPSGITIKDFVDLYIDSINIFPPENILKSTLDQIFNINTSDPYSVELDFISKFLTKKCNCKSEVEDDRSKSTFDLNYYDFINETPPTENDESIFTNIKFGPVDAPTPVIPKQPTLDEAYLNSVTVLSKDEFKLGNRTDKSDIVDNAINTVSQSQNNQTTNQNLPIKFNLKPNLSADVNLKILLSLPSILTMPLFSPKMTMFYGIIYKRYYITDPSKDLWTDRDGYYEFMGKLIELIIKEIMEYLLKKLFELIKKEIIKLIKKLIVKILGEKILGYVTQITSILNLIKSLTGSIPPTIPQINFKKCSSVLDGIESLFNIPNIPPGSTLPPGLSLMGMSKTGLSPTLMTQDAVKSMNDQGMDTKPMPDGSPNPNVVMASSMSKAVVNQIQSNARIQVSTVNGLVYGEGGGTIT